MKKIWYWISLCFMFLFSVLSWIIEWRFLYRPFSPAPVHFAGYFSIALQNEMPATGFGKWRLESSNTGCHAHHISVQNTSPVLKNVFPFLPWLFVCPSWWFFLHSSRVVFFLAVCHTPIPNAKQRNPRKKMSQAWPPHRDDEGRLLFCLNPSGCRWFLFPRFLSFL